MDRQELALFLRSRRERIAPAEVGLPAGTRRRTPGVLAGLARALRLSDSEKVSATKR